MATLKVKPWGEGQGDHVIIEEENFDPEFHELYDAPAAPEAPAPGADDSSDESSEGAAAQSAPWAK